MTQDPSQSRPAAVPQSRLARAGRMGAMAAGVAGNMAVGGLRSLSTGARPDPRDLLLTPANLRRVADTLAQMRGAAMKMGQLISMDTGDTLPPELAEILARLRADADFMPPKQLRNVLNDAWGPGWHTRFKRFDVRPIAAASIGQVHQAWLKDGTHLAIKVQYPGISRSIDSDVANLGRLLRLSGLLPKGFDLGPYLDEARDQLREEADYTAEAAHLERFGRLLEGSQDFVLPRFHPPLSSETVLAMSFVPSDPIENLGQAPADMRDRAVARLIALMLRELFDFGVMQTDPNFANYRIASDTGRIVLLDFGATRRLPEWLAPACRTLLQTGLRGERDAVAQQLDRMGLVPATTPAHHKARILDMVEMVFDTLRRHDTLDLAASDLPARLQAEGEALARAGFVPTEPVPLDLLFVQRKVAGMFLLAARLGATVPVRDLLAPHLDTPEAA
ncbi:AarF/ABC1/UbiB kinase family protein [uncultured Tateyamaria sp.]|uniref:ABC1 kinase family protein n=1 Tax=Tateyamaria sp. 1078 TaxID=3417464 RepID=UPI00263A2D52|nr:AarF/ABC1/UbiB kinase family protein [uncultured Tateyamaria sp.]